MSQLILILLIVFLLVGAPAAMAHIARQRAAPSIPPLIVAQGVELP